MKKHGLLFAALIIPTGQPDIEIINFAMVESTDSKRSLELNAKTARMYQDERLNLLNQVQGKVWGGSGAIYSIRADISIMDTDKQDFRTEGMTSISTPDAYLFETKNVLYTSSARTMTGKDKVILSPITKLKVAGEQFFLDGEGLRMDLRKDQLTILENVTAKQDGKNSKKLRITSKSFEFDTLNSNGKFVGNVRVKHPDYNMQGYSLALNFSKKNENDQRSLQDMFLRRNKASKVKAQIDKTTFRSDGFRITFTDSGELDKSEAIGSAEASLEDGVSIKAEKLYSFIEDGVSKFRMEEKVEIKTIERVAKCEQAIYTPSTGEFILYDVASLSDGDQTIKGEEIIFSTKNDFLKVKKASGKIQKSN